MLEYLTTLLAHGRVVLDLNLGDAVWTAYREHAELYAVDATGIVIDAVEEGHMAVCIPWSAIVTCRVRTP